jgi:hypothetical protein
MEESFRVKAGGVVEFKQNILLQNAKELRAKDSGGTERTIVRMNTSDQVEFFNSAGNEFLFNGNLSTNQFIFDAETPDSQPSLGNTILRKHFLVAVADNVKEAVIRIENLTPSQANSYHAVIKGIICHACSGGTGTGAMKGFETYMVYAGDAGGNGSDHIQEIYETPEQGDSVGTRGVGTVTWTTTRTNPGAGLVRIDIEAQVDLTGTSPSSPANIIGYVEVITVGPSNNLNVEIFD